METSSAFNTSWARIFTSCLYSRMILVLLINRLCNRMSSLLPIIHETCQGRTSNWGRELFSNYNNLCMSWSSASASGWAGFRWFSPSLWYINTSGLRWISKYFSRLPFVHQNDLPYVILTWLAVYRNCYFRFQGIVVIKKVTVNHWTPGPDRLSALYMRKVQSKPTQAQVWNCATSRTRAGFEPDLQRSCING